MAKKKKVRSNQVKPILGLDALQASKQRGDRLLLYW